jgi:hypothetical protein
MTPNTARGLKKHRRSLSLVAAALALALLADPGAPLSAQGSLLLPVRITARIANLQNLSPGASAGLEIDITRWSDPTEREQLIAASRDQGQNALRQALQAMPFHGHMSIPQWRGVDPHNVRLGWDLRYASNSALDDGGQRITIATDRYIGFWEAREQSSAIDYPFSVIEIRIDKKGRASGKIAAAARIDFDRTQNEMVLADYASEPVKLDKVTIAAPRKGRG